MWWDGPNIQRIGNHLSSDILPAQTASSAQIARLKATKAAYDRLTQELAVTNPDKRIATGTVPEQFQQAAVIGRPPQSPYDTLVIDIGDQSNVDIKAPVWWPPGVYLGEVVNVRERTAVVRLVSSPNARHRVRTTNGVYTELTGRGGGAMRAEVAKGLSVATGTQVISDRYGLPVGEIAAVERISGAGIAHLHVAQLVPMSVVEYVYVGEL